MSLLLLDPVATAPGSVFVWRRSSLPAEDKERKQKVWHPGSTNTERGAVATGSSAQQAMLFFKRVVIFFFVQLGVRQRPGRYRSSVLMY
jgi:hypothetical protein